METTNCIALCVLLDVSDWISIIGLIVNSFLAIWIVRSVQNSINNKRILKDHFINEVKSISEEYRIFINDLQLGKIYPKSVLPWFKMMNIKITDLLNVFAERYKIDKNYLAPYRDELNELITESDDYANNYKTNKLRGLL